MFLPSFDPSRCAVWRRPCCRSSCASAAAEARNASRWSRHQGTVGVPSRGFEKGHSPFACRSRSTTSPFARDPEGGEEAAHVIGRQESLRTLPPCRRRQRGQPRKDTRGFLRYDGQQSLYVQRAAKDDVDTQSFSVSGGKRSGMFAIPRRRANVLVTIEFPNAHRTMWPGSGMILRFRRNDQCDQNQENNTVVHAEPSG